MTIARIRLALLVVAAAAVVAAVFASIGGAASRATAPSPTAAPSISGTTQQGQTLTTTSGSWSGTTPMTFTYNWYRCSSGGSSCRLISGETQTTYKLTSDDVGHTIRSYVTAHNSAGSHSTTSNHTSVVTSASVPANSSLPTINGTPTVGGTLTASNGTWTGTAPITYAYQWKRCDTSGDNCAGISGGTKTTYALTNDDQGHTIRVTVVATNGAGQSNATSAQTAVVTAGAPANTVAPVISGTPTNGQTLSASTGTWTGTQPITYTYLWQLCDSAGNNCASIASANNPTFVLTAADVGHKVKVQVTGTNSGGSSSVTSAAVGPVAASTTTTPPPTTGTTVPASSISDSDRLTISSIKYSPGPFHGRGPITATIKVVDEHNDPVSGALVYVLPTPLNFANHPAEVPTGANGTATVQLTLTAKAPKSGGLILFIRARTPQGNILAGSSSRRLVQVRIFAK